jgi:DNA-binding transcriptional MerR regulator
VSGRSYLSIGDVLTLLRQEFPDVTISKIRFLESQGLVNPERTPSGYRKFYEQDVERLRWVLRQQREHFLPLKVIKGRLEAEGEFDDDLPPLDDLDEDRPDDRVYTSTDDEDVDVALGAEEPDMAADDDALERQRRPEPVLVGAPLVAATASRSGLALPGFETHSAGPAPVAAAEMSAATFAAASEEEPEKPVAPVAASAARRSGTSRPATTRGPSKASAAKEPVPPEAPPSTLSGTSMEIEELASATEMTVSDIQQLESFGLVTGRLVGGVTYYDDDALAVARAAAGFARFGIEARHLRFQKHAAEREAGFIEQIVLPLLKQRNPEARQRALDNVAELSRLGQSLRTVLLRNSLRDQLGG